MNKTFYALALMSLAATLPVSVSAAVNARQIDQQRRIDAGKRSGKLTERERLRLKAEQRSIVRMQHRMKARQRAAERNIYRAKHNAHRGKNHLPF